MSSDDLQACELFGGHSTDLLEPSGGPPKLQTKRAEWVELTERKRELEAQLRSLQDRLTVIEGPLIEDMALAGISSVKINGFNVFRQREFFARTKEGIDKETMIERLREAGLGNCLGLQHQTLRSLAREWADLGEEPPAAITDVVDLGDVFRLRTRKV